MRADAPATEAWAADDEDLAPAAGAVARAVAARVSAVQTLRSGRRIYSVGRWRFSRKDGRWIVNRIAPDGLLAWGASALPRRAWRLVQAAWRHRGRGKRAAAYRARKVGAP